MEKESLGIYIHIPFCSSKCKYCDFASFDNQFDKEDLYIENLVKEIELFDNSNYIVETVFIGGGTPSVLKPSNILKIGKALECFEFSHNVEFSVECNPCSINEEKFKAFKSIGVNRISFGLQSYNDDILKIIGRIHNVETFEKAYGLARKVGFDNINVDIMFNLPTQTVESFTKTLESVTKLKPEHISAYGLIIEEDTPFYDMVESGVIEMPDEDLDREMYELCESFLSEKGYNKYEISNYAKEGKECRHNLKYWEREDYIGFGLNSHSMINNIRFCNSSNLEDYLKENFYENCCYLEKEEVTQQQQIEEYVFLGLRLTKGLNVKNIEEKFNIKFYDVYKEVIDKFTKDELLTFDGEVLKLTSKGVSISNYVLSEFLL